ncbi:MULTISPECIES: hypothetical protein [Chitinophaga]|uniref:hypothetical protein n=1 Tax=Chitinophaga TaxID=79328 RepID=UPI000DBAB573|nr:hypothetical protein [Chitinophaga ginsengisegetis]MDR6568111.1 NRPS condensation-like uncharacterized protein [Chitinophaga ginsengisegetis]MDR6647334.1 NRPS condensation-like uncharacterized protein [Chitinophaga ginsengisegetis]MDR6653683.1 NRPS condensation-like uncharacterized protein [Chitinophaga ginsengisegetis]
MPNIQTNDFWLRLDNAAKIYPAIKDKELTSVFRVAVVLKDRVKAKAMLEAVNEIENRFPYYKVTLKAGFFWYYLEQQQGPIPVEADLQTPCRAFKKRELMFRILVKENKISVEFSHILTDGTGAFEFLKTLLLVYFEKCCIPLADKPAFYDPGEKPAPEEYEDAYSRYFKKIDAPHIKTPGAFHVPFSLKGKPRFSVLTAIMPIAQLSQKAKALGVSLTVYLTAVYLHALQQIHEQQPRLKKNINRKILRIEVPLNLRKLYPTQTMRNFSLYILPQIDLRLGHYTFEEIVKTVYHQMQLETDQKLINKMISRNVGGERNTLVRNIPLFLKSLFLSRLYIISTKQYSGVVTNLGKIDLGTAANHLIEQFIFIAPPPNKVLRVNCGVAGFGDNLVLSFGNITTSKELERYFLTFLTHQGIAVKIINS